MVPSQQPSGPPRVLSSPGGRTDGRPAVGTPARIDGRLFVTSPHDLATPRTTQDAATPGYGGNSPSMYSVGPGARGESMFNQPAFVVSRGMPATHAQPDIARNVYESASSALPTFFPVGNRAAESVHMASSNHESVRYLIVPPDRYNAAANNRRGRHDVANRPVYGTPSRRRIFGIPVGS